MAGKGTREISVFVDESGSFDPDAKSSQFYLVCMVFHDQDVSIAENVLALNVGLREIGLAEDHAVHAGPLIRWESPYRNLRRQDRRVVFAKMLAFLRRIDVTYRCFHVDKRFVDDVGILHDRLLQQIVAFLSAHAAEFNAYDKLKVYYDNGQSDVSLILKDAFALFSSKIEFVPNVTPEKYKLFQVADMIATLELVRLKLETEGHISDAEKEFFLSIQNLKKNFLKPTARKRHE